MSKSIEQVKKLVEKACQNSKNERELSIKGLQFGQWWHEVENYQKAEEWILRYLKVFDKDAKAHKLLGDVYEKISKTDAALKCYKNSLRVKPQQYELMLKVAEMHINPGPCQNPSRAEVWLDKAAFALPNNPQVYKLKMELYLAQEAPPSKLEGAILDELKKRPNDPTLYVQYVSFLKDQERIAEAFTYSERAESDVALPRIVERDFEWNQAIIDTCQEFVERTCDDEVTLDGIRAYTLLLVTLSKFILICLEHARYGDAIENLAILDSTILTASMLNTESTKINDSQWNAVLTEVKGQLYWLTGTLLISQASKSEIPWSEANSLSAACFGTSLSFEICDTSSKWAHQSSNANLALKLKAMGSVRLSQCGHMLNNVVSITCPDHTDEIGAHFNDWIDDISYNYCTDEGRKKIISYLFGVNYNPESSMIATYPAFSRGKIQFLDDEELSRYDLNAVTGLSLQTWVWMAIQWKHHNKNSFDPFLWIEAVFPELSLTVSSSVKYGNAWNLCRLDVESFIVACSIHCEKALSTWQGTKIGNQQDALSQASMPLPLCRKLVTEQQKNWWDAACKLYSSRNKERIVNPNQLKITLRHGIESLRGSGNHGLELSLITGLAKHFTAKAANIEATDLGRSCAPWLAYQGRAFQYWSLALPKLKDLTENRIKQQLQPKNQLFLPILDEPTIVEARSMISDAYMCHAALLEQEGDLQKALDAYGMATTPQASFQKALIYKKLLDKCCQDDYSMSSKNATKRKELNMTKYRAQLEVTLNRLERSPEEDLLRKTKELLGQSLPQNTITMEDNQLQLPSKDKETLQQIPSAANHTVYSEVDESILAIPSKQSTPKSKIKSVVDAVDKSAVEQLSQNLTSLSSAVSTLQAAGAVAQQLNVLTNAVPSLQSTASPMAHQLSALANELKAVEFKAGERNPLGQLSKNLSCMAIAISTLQSSKTMTEDLNSLASELKSVNLKSGDSDPSTDNLASLVNTVNNMQKREEMMQQQLRQLQDQMQNTREAPQYPHQSLPGTPVPGGHMVNMAHPKGMLPHTPMQVFDQYHQAVMGPTGTPVAGSPFYNVYPYQGYPPQNAAMTPLYNPQRYPVTPSGMYPGNARLGPMMMDPHASPSHTPRPQQQTQNSGLPMSKEAADALSVRFQTSLIGNSSPAPGQNLGIMHPGGPRFQANQGNMFGSSEYPTTGMDPKQLNSNVIQHQSPSSKFDARQSEADFDERYIPPMPTNTARPDHQASSVLHSLLSTQKSEEVLTSPKQVEINYPKHIAFPKGESDASAANPTWNFKFQTPEEMDKANMKLEADEEAEDAETLHNDTGPHFEPLVSLPEVKTCTGEENEDEAFSERSKLYRWHETEWKERGLGHMKVLRHKETGKYRLLMRREQVLKICCNHIISKDINLTAMQKSDCAWVWHAHDFADEEGKVEKFAIRFKTAEIATKFKQKVEEGKAANIKLSGNTPVRPTAKHITASTTIKTSITPSTTATAIVKPTEPKPTSSEGGLPKFNFVFPKPSAAAISLAAKIAGTSPVKEKTEVKQNEEEEDYVQHNESDGPHFEPIVQLPEKVEQITGEEDEEVMFSHRAKLYRYTDKQWKERGIGDIKILRHVRRNKYRIVMRREQVLKLCANHNIIPSMDLSAHANSDKAWTWTAMDHSEPDEDPKPELFAVRFKFAETATEFKKFFDKAKQGTETPSTSDKTQITTQQTKPNTGIFKIAAFATDNKVSSSSTSAKSGTVGSSGSEIGPSVPAKQTGMPTTGQLVASKKPGQWDCPTCCVTNASTDATCPCCGEANPNMAAADAKKSAKPFSSVFSQSKSSGFSFGVPSTTTAQTLQKTEFKASENKTTGKEKLTAAKQPLGTWICSACDVPNKPDDATCVCCGQANPSGKPTKGQSKPFVSNIPALKSSGFSFGVPSSPTTAAQIPGNTNKNEPVAQPFTNTAKPSGGYSFGVFNTTRNSNVSSTLGTTPTFGVSQNSSDQPQNNISSENNSPAKAMQCQFSFGVPAKPTIWANQKSSIFSLPVPKSASKGDLISFEHAAAKPAPDMFSQLKDKPSFGIPSANAPTPSVFGQVTSQQASKPNPSTELAKPRFPSVGDDESDDDDEESSNGTYGSSYDEEDGENEEENPEIYRSPLNRQQDQQNMKKTDNTEDADVICLGEVLPSVELQLKAEKLLLPKHFYNYVKEGEKSDEDEESDKVDKPHTATISSGASSIPTISAGSGFGFGSTMSFTDLAKNSSQTAGGFSFSGTLKSAGWPSMTGQKSFFGSPSPANNKEGSKDDNEYYETEENNDAHFEPIVKLPEKVDVITGEEDEETICSQRCKLFRFVKESKEWKERGIGDIKMMKNRKTGRIRIVMRREQVLKVCANHYIRPGMMLDLNKNSDRAWMWSAMDFADEGEPKMEMFTAKFKTVENALEFKENFERCQTMLLDADPMTPCKASTLRTKELSDKAEKMKDELKYFKDKFSQPTKIDLENTLTEEGNIPESIPTVPVGALTPLVVQHRNKAAAAKQQPYKPVIDWTKGTKENEESEDLASKPKEVQEETTVISSSKNSDEKDPQTDEPDIQFEPIVKLPDKVELLTGEEDEHVLFSNRAKLYIFDSVSKQWKERGLGDVKIMQNLKSHKVRLIMRREQVLKVCLNHYLQSDISFSFKSNSDNKVVVWTSLDYSDDEKKEGEFQQFAIRFKSSDRALAFMNLSKEGQEANTAKTLLEPDVENINTSVHGARITSPGPTQEIKSPQSPTSPVKSAISTFSFANIQSPLHSNQKTSSDSPVNVMGFVFGKADPNSSTMSKSEFKFDVSKMSFNFSSPAGTPSAADRSDASTVYFTPTQSTPYSKSTVSKTLFGDSGSGDTGNNAAVGNLFTKAEAQPTTSEISSSTKSSNVWQNSQAGNSFKPSPLAVESGSNSTPAFSVQGTGISSKFQFKPVTNGQYSKSDDDDDVIFVCEAVPTDDQRLRAEKLKLPKTFFLFEDKPFPSGYDEKKEEEKEDRILQYIEDRDSGKNTSASKQCLKITADNTVKPSIEKQTDKTSETKSGNSWVFGGGMQENSTGSSFASMAANVGQLGFKKNPSFQFPGAGQVMFQNLTETNADGDQDPNFQCEAQFKPVLENLPPLVEVATGEEGEEILFKERCKLFRFDKASKQWKERGVGDIKILRNDQHNLYRVVMRREQVLKVCANHVIKENTTLEYHLGSLKTCTYFAMDYTESAEPTPEQFAIRFKNEELCKKYMDQIEEIKAIQKS